VHRDIKPENVLFVGDTVKLADFGSANQRDKVGKETVCGTPEYIAPEMVMKKGHDEKADVWGFGVLFFELLEGKTPFSVSGRADLKTQDALFHQLMQNILVLAAQPALRHQDEENRLARSHGLGAQVPQPQPREALGLAEPAAPRLFRALPRPRRGLLVWREAAAAPVDLQHRALQQSQPQGPARGRPRPRRHVQVEHHSLRQPELREQYPGLTQSSRPKNMQRSATERKKARRTMPPGRCSLTASRSCAWKASWTAALPQAAPDRRSSSGTRG
jgi:serine/threonine protein kinase